MSAGFATTTSWILLLATVLSSLVLFGSRLIGHPRRNEREIRTFVVVIVSVFVIFSAAKTATRLLLDPYGHSLAAGSYVVPSWHPDSMLIEGIVVMLGVVVIPAIGVAGIAFGQRWGMRACVGAAAFGVVWQLYQLQLGADLASRTAWLALCAIVMLNGAAPWPKNPETARALL